MAAMTRNARRALIAPLLLVMLVLTACGGNIRDFIGDTYALQNTSGDARTYTSKDPIGTTVSKIVSEEAPAARKADGGSEYLRYDDDIVTVSGAPGGGSLIRVEDIDGRYRSGGFAYLGPGFNPGSPAGGAGGSGGSGDAK
ncbi:DUF4247 domain-containing protein [Rhodococcus oxybenzonivorans]|uniref:DUF4247 domain-containing protein n=2 Tax=Nocardiaceae TaxID=85025 RepID=A0AAE5A7R7_9NOCA|nr:MULTISPECIES: DUF4247 domain-containing protein [Rhodococcus]MDV7241300.1 DUF4247 domain-containing protein [Rhodococcus oxybenzonivorans]MDV7265959.1 DUF4247 domain-containing protein [Rhodococcus oxybenzonivorans]MDV7274167.1 DUF4247 domain-containing protein [Rhodococcus oxybenzonivorans]MDV7333580.1 DUF4247 domain-containing protein [Rhodococcus oxybenzonivorans]MDV7343000.1 DUF4247 domain-containing protein [Rhodococcus oxybenzonivorans]